MPKHVQEAAQTAAISAAVKNVFKGNTNVEYRVVACVIRNTGTGFEILDDAGHTPIGVASVTTAADGLSVDVNYNFTGTEVASLVATVDETLAVHGYQVGASVAVDHATLFVGQPAGFGDYIYWDGAAWVSLNGYITSVSMNATTGLVTANHAALTGPVSGSVVSRSLTKRASMEGLSTTATTFYLVDNAGTTVKTPTTDNKVWITRSGARRVPMSELTQSGSNIWVMGVVAV